MFRVVECRALNPEPGSRAWYFGVLGPFNTGFKGHVGVWVAIWDGGKGFRMCTGLGIHMEAGWV